MYVTYRQTGNDYEEPAEDDPTKWITEKIKVAKRFFQ
jgi:hypothetical protein